MNIHEHDIVYKLICICELRIERQFLNFCLVPNLLIYNNQRLRYNLPSFFLSRFLAKKLVLINIREYAANALICICEYQIKG